MNFDDYSYNSDVEEQEFIIVQEYTGYRTMIITASSLTDAIEQIESGNEDNVYDYSEDEANNVHGRVVSAKVIDYE